MPIIYHQSTQTFHLYNETLSYIIKVLPSGHLGQLYYGKKIHDQENFDHLFEIAARAMAVCYYEGDRTYSLEHIKNEYPTYGSGDQHLPAIDLVQENGSHILEFHFDSYQIIPGKPKLKGLPATYVEKDEEASTLIITLKDDLLDCYLNLSYTIYENMGALCRNVHIENKGNQTLNLQQIMSMSLDLPDQDYDLIELTGAWSRERNITERSLEMGVQSIYSIKGHSSHNFNPFIALKRKETTETSGEILGFSLVYSGNFLAQVDVDTYHVSRVMMGIHPQNFNWLLKANESFQTPEVVMVYSDQGLNDMSQTYHQLYRTRLARGKYRDQVRPILINNWEGTYFDFTEEKLLNIASTAKELGIELFVLDDGWFGKRNNDLAGLGDWYPNLNKLPDGIAGLSKKVNDLGLKFGLWFEPEMINLDSDLYRAHPEMMLATPSRHQSHGRAQFILDFSNPKVVEYIYQSMKKILDESSISYIKWDMNRAMSEVYSSCHDASSQGRVMHEYILGVYHLYDLLTTNYPDILFESCASGGARFDPGLLYYAPQAWTSDDTDAIERIKIQYGTSLVYPISSMGSHVSAIPNHQLYRNTPLETRANVAYFGTFGYELDPTKLSEEEKIQIKKQINFMKTYRQIIQYGSFYRLKSPFKNLESAWMVVSPDQKTALVAYFRPLQEVNVGYRRIKLTGLNPNFNYHNEYANTNHFGDELMNLGLITTDASSSEHNMQFKQGDYLSRIYILKAK